MTDTLTLLQQRPKSTAMDKDDVELELEKLVFGDDEGFKRELQLLDDDSDTGRPSRTQSLKLKPSSINALEQRDLSALDDSELFFFDTGSGPAKQEAVTTSARAKEIKTFDAPAWVDSDDERITVSLASSSRLRKLRRSEAEDHVNGTEYTTRLREQFERLHPAPDWATKLRSKGNAHRRKRRRLSESTNTSSSEAEAEDMSDDDDIEFDSEDIRPGALAEVLQSTNSLVRKTPRKRNGIVEFRPEILDVQRLKDMSGTYPSAILSLSFHPTLPLLLSSGPSGLMVLHHLAPNAPSANPTLTRVALRKLHVQHAYFHPSGTRVVLTAHRPYFHVWDLDEGRFQRVSSTFGRDTLQRTCEQFAPSPCGRYLAFIGSGKKGGGQVHVVDASTGQWICAGRAEGQGGVADIAWWRSGDGLSILGKGGDVLEYSVRERRPVARWTDEGAVGATLIALGGASKSSGGDTDRYVAVGSSAGIVNVYDRSQWWNTSWTDKEDATNVPEHPKPLRSLDQLVTSISSLTFSPDGQLLAMASKDKKDALRIVHLPTCTVYRNWPTSNTPLGKVSALAWTHVNGSGGGIEEGGELVLAVANEAGKIRLWQLRG